MYLDRVCGGGDGGSFLAFNFCSHSSVLGCGMQQVSVHKYQWWNPNSV